MGPPAQWIERKPDRFEFAGTGLHWILRGDRPDQGIAASNARDSATSWNDHAILEVDLSASITSNGFQLLDLPANPYPQVDSWTRNQDLLLRYDEQPTRAIEFSTMFRCEAADGNSTEWDHLEWVLSMQTSLLDAKPYQAIQGRLPFGEVQLIPLSQSKPGGGADHSEAKLLGLANNGPAALILWADTGCHVIAGYPGDWRGLQLSWDEGGLRWQANLRADHLEKGVIRRLRCLWAFRPQATREQAMEKIAQFQASHLPLS